MAELVDCTGLENQQTVKRFISSNLIASARIRDVVQLVRMLVLGTSGHVFESHYPDNIWGGNKDSQCIGLKVRR